MHLSCVPRFWHAKCHIALLPCIHIAPHSHLLAGALFVFLPVPVLSLCYVFGLASFLTALLIRYLSLCMLVCMTILFIVWDHVCPAAWPPICVAACSRICYPPFPSVYHVPACMPLTTSTCVFDCLLVCLKFVLAICLMACSCVFACSLLLAFLSCRRPPSACVPAPCLVQPDGQSAQLSTCCFTCCDCCVLTLLTIQSSC